jgi:hypothetical protein
MNLDGGNWSDSCFGHIIPKESALSKHKKILKDTKQCHNVKLVAGFSLKKSAFNSRAVQIRFLGTK